MQYQLDQWQSSSWLKGTRYYSISVGQDIFGHWIVTRTWGRHQTRGAGKSLTNTCQNYQQALTLFQQQQSRRLKRGYVQQ